MLSRQDDPTRIVPELPVEILEDIIDEASATSDISTVSSISLTSHAFRIIANKRRFQSLVLYRNVGHDIDHTARKIRTLAGLISDAYYIDTMPGVVDFATSLSLQMIGYYDEVTPAIEDGSLAYIFNNIFRSTTFPTWSADCSLSLYIYRWARTDDEYYDDDPDFSLYNEISWNSIDKTLLTALQNVIQASQLTRLELESMKHVPRNLLQGSNIKHLGLHGTELNSAITHFQDETSISNQPILLESLHMDSDVSDKDIWSLTHPYTELAGTPDYNHHPSLVHFSIYVSYSKVLIVMNQVLSCAPALQSLVVDLGLDPSRSLHYFWHNDSYRDSSEQMNFHN